MRQAVILLTVIWLTGCGSSDSPAAKSMDGSITASQSCSTDPDRGPNGWIDPTESKRGAEVFNDPNAATLADAVKRNDIVQVKTLLREGSNPNATGEGGVTILDWALRRERTEAFDALLQAGADPTKKGLQTRSAVHDAAIADDTTFLKMLVARHADINVKTADGETPLDLAIMARCDKQFHLLIAAGADLHLSDTVGNTALHRAAMIDDLKSELDLLKAGADPLARNGRGDTFQRFLNMMPQGNLTNQARIEIANIHSWLIEHNVPIEERPKEEVMPWQRRN